MAPIAKLYALAVVVVTLVICGHTKSARAEEFAGGFKLENHQVLCFWGGLPSRKSDKTILFDYFVGWFELGHVPL